ncbi:MAG: hypothetical protein V3V20_12830 [Algisphaera sp.]
MTQAPPPTPRPASNPAPNPGPRRSVVGSTVRGTRSVIMLAFIGGLTYMGYQLLRNRIAAEVYEERLIETTQELNQLAQQYNKAVTLTAVTELEVGENDLCVNVRTADGEVDRHPISDINLANDIYIDYVVKDSRLLIRRVFDSTRAPDDARAIDSELLAIDWNDPAVSHGQAIYRKLSPGRWIVAASGSGALTLAKVETDVEVKLMPAPKVSAFSPVEETAKEIQSIGPTEVIGRLFGSDEK